MFGEMSDEYKKIKISTMKTVRYVNQFIKDHKLETQDPSMPISHHLSHFDIILVALQKRAKITFKQFTLNKKMTRYVLLLKRYWIY